MSNRWKAGFIQVFFDPLTVGASTGSELYAAGDNDHGQLGLNDQGTTTNHRSSPVQVGTDINWDAVSGGYDHAGGIKKDGTLWLWGRGTYGQLGQNDRVDRSSPTQVGALTTWSRVEVSQRSTVAIKTDGTIWTWGGTVWGMLGNNTTYADSPGRSSPVQLGSETTWSDLSVGQNAVAALKTDGTWWAWGFNNAGVLGDGTNTSRSSPIQIGSDTDWAAFGTDGTGSTWAVKTDGELYATGRNTAGQLGLNNTSPNYRSSPVQVGALTNWVTPRAGDNHMKALKTDGTLWMCGSNNAGNIGNNTVDNVSSPVQIGSAEWSTISSGVVNIAVKTNGTMWTWGRNQTGGTGQNSVSDGISSPVQLGSETTWSKGTSSQGATDQFSFFLSE